MHDCVNGPRRSHTRLGPMYDSLLIDVVMYNYAVIKAAALIAVSQHRHYMLPIHAAPIMNSPCRARYVVGPYAHDSAAALQVKL